ncbi:hypothetical protein HO173_003630 [Letharia columbiana]|uniref:Uncharacterized protein n=1 Tax=Letharia columbiana TaxID=112416 RepID=A0A8H6G0Q3_9LECA|nr:uncharacterized protein HO173_003630 [Letharia columbiana]KAF6238350.1 hypothetical protein HO173_003630 [Letharia columbiana]
MRASSSGSLDMAVVDTHTLLAEVEYSLNTAENASTGSITPFEALYGVKPRDFRASIIPGRDSAPTDFIKARETIRNDTSDAIKLAQAKMAARYDAKHRIPDLVGSVYLKLARNGAAGYHIPKNSLNESFKECKCDSSGTHLYQRLKGYSKVSKAGNGRERQGVARDEWPFSFGRYHDPRYVRSSIKAKTESAARKQIGCC